MSGQDDNEFKRGREAASLTQSLISEVRDLSMAIATYSAELKPIREDIRFLIRVVRDGGASGDHYEPLMSRVDQIEHSLEEIEGRKMPEFDKDIDDMKKAIIVATDAKAVLFEDKKDHRERRGQKFQFWGTIIVAFLSLAATIFGLIHGTGTPKP